VLAWYTRPAVRLANAVVFSVGAPAYNLDLGFRSAAHASGCSRSQSVRRVAAATILGAGVRTNRAKIHTLALSARRDFGFGRGQIGVPLSERQARLAFDPGRPIADLGLGHAASQANAPGPELFPSPRPPNAWFTPYRVHTLPRKASLGYCCFRMPALGED
jgi:hypothetical protein